MDDPMIRSRLGRITGARPLGPWIPSRGPSFFLQLFARVPSALSYFIFPSFS
jgi:hypothetical protein